jgi:hypothetical protein
VDSSGSGFICGQIVPLNAAQESLSEPLITSTLHTAPFSVASTPAPLTHGLKFKTSVNDDDCSITVAFPGNQPQEAEGMFGGMKWKDFITTYGEHQPEGFDQKQDKDAAFIVFDLQKLQLKNSKTCKQQSSMQAGLLRDCA